MTFQKPDEKTIARMTPQSISLLIDGLKAKRNEVTAPYDEQIKYYEELRAKKLGADNAKAAS